MVYSILKYACVFIYTPAIFELITDLKAQITIPKLNIKKNIHYICSYCKCSVCEQNRKLGLPLIH